MRVTSGKHCGQDCLLREGSTNGKAESKERLNFGVQCTKIDNPVTVAILAQGTSWAVAATQAFFCVGENVYLYFVLSDLASLERRIGASRDP